MRLVTFQSNGQTRLGAWIDADRRIVDLALAAERRGSAEPAFASMQSLIEGGQAALDRARECVAAGDDEACLLTTQCRILAPLPQPAQLRDFVGFPGHVKGCRVTTAELTIAASPDPAKKRAEMEAAGLFGVPADFYAFPIYYVSNRFSVSGTGDDIPWPTFSRFIDFELEWAAVIGKSGSGISKDRARDFIFGYTIFNDWSARDEQIKTMAASSNAGPCAGKDFANTLGPCIVTADEIADPYALNMRAYLNDDLIAQGNTADMHYRFEDMIAYLTRGHSIQPGEVIGSGTAPGGCGFESRRLIQPGDVVELQVDSIGSLRNRVVASHFQRDPNANFNVTLGQTLRALQGLMKT